MDTRAQKIVLAVAALAAAIIPAASQTLPQTPAFEVASIRPNNSGSRSSGISIHKGGRFTATNLTAKMLIITAYKLQEYQIVGGPPWMEADHYDVTATSEENVTQDRVVEMIKGLLADRFGLKFHHESRNLPVYALVTAKNGSKLKRNTDGGDSHKSSSERGKITGQNLLLETFVILLSSQLDRLVVDRTGLTDRFDAQLEWSSDSSGPGTPAESAAAPSTAPSIFTAIQEQLGLRLESAKALLDTAVIDRLERPSEN